MRTEQNYSDLIYEYFLARFHFQYYRQGDLLPAVSLLCQEFGVAEKTVMTALKRLRAEGYISMHNGMNTRVIFQQTRTDSLQYAACFFSERWDGILDLAKTSELIMNPFLMHGLELLDVNDIAHLGQVAGRAHTNDLLYIFYFILQKSENPLVMNLFWEMAFYIGVPFIRDLNMEVYLKTFEKELAALGADSSDPPDRSRITDVLLGFFNTFLKTISDYLNLPLQLPPHAGNTTFTWRIYRQQPQVCYSLASVILHDIYLGSSQGREYLPSYQKMAQQYQVSLSTVRRSISQLERLGAVQPVNGLGIRIVTAPSRENRPDFSDAVVQKNLAFYFQSYELIICSCEQVGKTVLQALSQEEWAGLIRQLEEYLESGLCELTLCYLLRFLALHSPLCGVREIYEKIYDLFLLGYPLKISLPETTSLNRATVLFTEAVIGHLKHKAAADFGIEIKNFVSCHFPKAARFLAQHGLLPGDMRMPQPIRFLISDGA